MKVGIGVGDIGVVHVGGTSDGKQSQRMEYIATGSPLVQAFQSEHHAVSGQVICSPQVWEHLSDYFVAVPAVHESEEHHEDDGFKIIEQSQQKLKNKVDYSIPPPYIHMKH